MKTINLEGKNIDKIFEKMNIEFGGTLELDSTEKSLKVNSSVGSGSIKGMELQNGVSYLEFDLTVNDDIKIAMDAPKKSIVNFVYCAKGKMGHSFSRTDRINTVETFQTGITSNIITSDNNIYLYKDTPVNAIIISVNTLNNTIANNKVNETLYKLFIDGKTKDYLYLGSYNLQIAETARQLKTITQKGLARTLLTEGLINMMLGLEIEQHTRDINNANCNTGSLTKIEMERVREISEFINHNPETNLGVNELAQKAALSQSKLQEGFKLMHNKTVNSYVRSVRVEKSEQLIKSTDMNISEIVYALGFTSRSYFSHIFKDRFNCSPNVYRSKIRLAATA